MVVRKVLVDAPERGVVQDLLQRHGRYELDESIGARCGYHPVSTWGVVDQAPGKAQVTCGLPSVRWTRQSHGCRPLLEQTCQLTPQDLPDWLYAQDS